MGNEPTIHCFRCGMTQDELGQSDDLRLQAGGIMWACVDTEACEERAEVKRIEPVSGGPKKAPEPFARQEKHIEWMKRVEADGRDPVCCLCGTNRTGELLELGLSGTWSCVDTIGCFHRAKSTQKDCRCADCMTATEYLNTVFACGETMLDRVRWMTGEYIRALEQLKEKEAECERLHEASRTIMRMIDVLYKEATSK